MQKQTLQAKYQEMQNNLVSNILSVIENSDEKLRWFKYCDSSIFLPHNAGSKRVYNGGNRAHLALAAWINEYNDPRWMTFNQVRKAGYKVKKDTKGCRVMKWATVPIVEEDEDGNKTIRGSRLTLQGIYTVFNASCIEGIEPYEIPELKISEQEKKLEAITSLLAESSQCPITEALTDTACYSLTKDEIIMPYSGTFKSIASYLATMLHEMGHSTGAAGRLNRKQVTQLEDMQA